MNKELLKKVILSNENYINKTVVGIVEWIRGD